MIVNKKEDTKTKRKNKRKQTKQKNKRKKRKDKKIMTFTKNKQIKNAYKLYKQSSDKTLRDVYGSYSRAKEKAYYYCLELCDKLDGINPKIISHNSIMFTFGFEFSDLNTGEINFAYITKDNIRYAHVSDIEEE